MAESIRENFETGNVYNIWIQPDEGFEKRSNFDFYLGDTSAESRKAMESICKILEAAAGRKIGKDEVLAEVCYESNYNSYTGSVNKTVISLTKDELKELNEAYIGMYENEAMIPEDVVVY
ncbi:MAG: hypothetical protein Q4C42_06990 [Clostridia bacterium]|nr:hypothetical protein [Clostridia bacterium]